MFPIRDSGTPQLRGRNFFILIFPMVILIGQPSLTVFVRMRRSLWDCSLVYLNIGELVYMKTFFQVSIAQKNVHFEYNFRKVDNSLYKTYNDIVNIK